MRDIYVYTPTFVPVCIESRVTSMQWEVCYDAHGTFELHTSQDRPLLQKVLEAIAQDKEYIFMQGENAGVMTGLSVPPGISDFAIHGKGLSYMLKWRVVKPFSAKDTAENIIREKVREAFMDRGSVGYISGFEMAPALGDTERIDYATENMKSLYDVVQDICRPQGLGFDIACNIASKQFLFSLCRGTDRSTAQSARVPLIFSEDNKNIEGLEYTVLADGYASCGYYQKTTEPSEGSNGEATVSYPEITKDEKTGFWRREMVLSATDYEEAHAELLQAAWGKEMEGEAKIIRYGTDFALGDIVTVQKQFDRQLLTQHKRISSVRIVYEPKQEYEKPIFMEV